MDTSTDPNLSLATTTDGSAWVLGNHVGPIDFGDDDATDVELRTDDEYETLAKFIKDNNLFQKSRAEALRLRVKEVSAYVENPERILYRRLERMKYPIEAYRYPLTDLFRLFTGTTQETIIRRLRTYMTENDQYIIRTSGKAFEYLMTTEALTYLVETIPVKQAEQQKNTAVVNEQLGLVYVARYPDMIEVYRNAIADLLKEFNPRIALVRTFEKVKLRLDLLFEQYGFGVILNLNGHAGTLRNRKRHDELVPVIYGCEVIRFFIGGRVTLSVIVAELYRKLTRIEYERTRVAHRPKASILAVPKP